jgi:serine protease
MSLGGDNPCNAAYQDAVNKIIAAGTTIVVAAGNSDNAVAAPANCAGVVAVGALRHVGTKGGYSNLGPEVAISAPGGNCVNTAAGSPCLYPILSTWNSGTTTPQNSTYTESFNYFYGTSFSAPLVAGTVALMLSAQPALTPYQIRVLLQATARAFPTTGGDNGRHCSTAMHAAAVRYFGNPIDQLQCYCTTDVARMPMRAPPCRRQVPVLLLRCPGGRIW